MLQGVRGCRCGGSETILYRGQVRAGVSAAAAAAAVAAVVVAVAAA